MERRRLRPYHGIIVFGITILLLFFVFSGLQYFFGMTGLAITEIGFLLLAVVPAVILKQDLREVFPIKRPRFRELVGTVLIWVSCLLLGGLAAQISGFLLPGRLETTSEVMSTMFTSVSFFFSFLIVAVLPAVCEEALHRGFILYSFKGIKRDWQRIILMGVIFGIFHLSGVRFATTAILGLGLTYVMIRSENILVPVFFHFINNALSVTVNYLMTGTVPTTPEVGMPAPLMVISSYLIIGCGIPLFLLFGTMLMNEKEKRLSGKKLVVRVILCLALLIIMFLAGVLIMAPFVMESAGSL